LRSTSGVPVFGEISVTTLPKKTVYTLEDKLDLSGMVVIVSYDFEHSEKITGYTSSPKTAW